jgi:hypothetical protein
MTLVTSPRSPYLEGERQVPFATEEEAMRIRNMVVVAVPALLALALLQPQPQPASVPQEQPSAGQIHAAVQLAEAGAGLQHR